MREVTCDRCGRSKPFYEVSKGMCAACTEDTEHAAKAEAARLLKERIAKMVMTTETAINLPISERLGVVGSQCALGMSMFKDILTAGRDLFGGRSSTIQQQLSEGRETALSEMKVEAARIGADAVIAISLTFSEFSGGGSKMLFIAATGTAVRLEAPAP